MSVFQTVSAGFVRTGAANLIAVVVVLAAASQAFAHARYDHSEPAENATLASAPPRVTIFFNQLLDGTKSTITVVDAAGTTVSQGPIQALPSDAHAMQVDLRPGLGNGVYTVRWHTLSAEDGEDADGSFTFTVGGAPAAAAAAPAPASPVGTSAGTTAATFVSGAAEDAEHTHESIEEAEAASTPAEMRAAAQTAATHGREVVEQLDKAMDVAAASAHASVRAAHDAAATVVQQAERAASASDADTREQVAQLVRSFAAFEPLFATARAAVGGPGQLPRMGEAPLSPVAAALGLAGVGLALAGGLLLLRRGISRRTSVVQ